jgi:lipopolysaccharide export system protein LptA
VRASKNGAVFIVAATLFLGVSARAGAAGFNDLREADAISTSAPVYFSGDTFSYNAKTGIITGTGDIEVIQLDRRLRGDKVVIRITDNVAEIEGNVVATRGADVVRGTRGMYDFEKQEGAFEDAQGFSEPWYVSAGEIKRETSGRYAVADGSLTTCNLPHPHYRIESGTVEVIPEERLVARDLVLYAGSFPIFYFPYYAHGLQDRPPVEFTAGSQTDLGAYARLGYNLELTEDILLNPHIWGFTKSGVGGGLDGRFRLFDGTGRGRFDTFYISDQNEDNTDPPGIDKDRGKADLYYRQELPYDFTTLLQTEYVSDREFLKTYDFDDFSERELPETFFNIERTGEHSVASLLVRERLVDYTTDVERLPGLRLELLEQEFRDTGFFASATNESAYLNVEPGGSESARNFTQARVAYPMRYDNWLSLVPFVEGDGTYYSKTLTEEDEYRISGSAGLTAQSRFQKVYGSPIERYTALRHLIVPTINYRYRPTPDDEPEDLPQFDSVDLIDRENLLEVELKNYVQAKRPNGRRTELLQYNVTTGLEFDDDADTLATLENEVLIHPVPNWEWAFKALNDFRDERRTDLVSTVLRYSKAESFRASVGMIHEDTVLKPYETQVVYSFSKAFGPLWRVGFQQRYDIDMEEMTYQDFWLWRDLHCWEILLSVTDRREATTFMVLLNIKAFPMGKIENKTAIKPIGEKHPWPTRW